MGDEVKRRNCYLLYEFYAVFESPAEYLVKHENQVIGTIQESVPIGNHFALAGRAWECIDIDEKLRVVFVNPVIGISKIAWLSTSCSDLHKKVIQKMRDVLLTDLFFHFLLNIQI